MSKYGYYLGMTPEQQDIVKMIREFAERELDPVVKEYDEKGEFPVQLHEKWGEMGLFGLDVPEQYGGLGLNAVTRYCISEELAKHDAGFTISNNSYSFGLSAILADGTEAQKQAACARILRGEGISMAITEPQSGSDVGSTRTSAKKVDGGYVLNGVKCFITNATLCSACVVLAVTNPDAVGRQTHDHMALLGDFRDEPGHVQEVDLPVLEIVFRLFKKGCVHFRHVWLLSLAQSSVGDILCRQAADDGLGVAHDLLDHVLGLGQIGDALRTLAGAGHGVLHVALIGRSNTVTLEGQQLHRDAREVIRHTDVGAGGFLGGVVSMLQGHVAAQPARRADKAAGNDRAAVGAIDDHLLPQFAEIALFGGEEAGAHLHAVSAHGEGRRD